MTSEELKAAQDNWRVDCDQMIHQAFESINLAERIKNEGHIDACDHLEDLIKRTTNILNTANRMHVIVDSAVTTRDQDFAALSMMTRYGGSFVAALAEVAYKSDADNYQRLKAAFPDIWKRYEDFAKQVPVGGPTHDIAGLRDEMP